jgi:CRP-like cAMP-binding protein
VIDHDSRIRRVWDAAQFFIVCYVGVVIPLRIGFNITEWRAWAAPDVIGDVMFLMDIVMNILTTYELEGEVVKDRSDIFWRYFRSWFWLDVISVIPAEIVAAGIDEYTPIYRANRFIRFLRIGGYFATWERDSSIKPTLIRLMKSAISFLYFTHFIGCMYYIILRVEGDLAQPDFIGQEFTLLEVESLTSRYFRAWYWAMAVMPGFNNANPTTILELVFTCFFTLSGIMFFATIIGAVGDMATNLDSSKIYFRAKLDEIDDYMQYKKIPIDLQDDVKAYYNYLWKSGKALEKNDLLRDLPQYLKNKMSLYLNRAIVSKVPLFQKYADDEKFITALVMSLKSIVCLPNFFIVRKGEIGTDMFFVSRGELNVVTDDGHVVFTFRDGGFFGEIALLFDTKRTATIVSRTYCDMFNLTKEDFKKVLRQFPEQSKGIKEIAKERFQKIVDDEKKKETADRAKTASDQDVVREQQQQQLQADQDTNPTNAAILSLAPQVSESTHSTTTSGTLVHQNSSSMHSTGMMQLNNGVRNSNATTHVKFVDEASTAHNNNNNNNNNNRDSIISAPPPAVPSPTQDFATPVQDLPAFDLAEASEMQDMLPNGVPPRDNGGDDSDGAAGGSDSTTGAIERPVSQQQSRPVANNLHGVPEGTGVTNHK